MHVSVYKSMHLDCTFENLELCTQKISFKTNWHSKNVAYTSCHIIFFCFSYFPLTAIPFYPIQQKEAVLMNKGDTSSSSKKPDPELSIKSILNRMVSSAGASGFPIMDAFSHGMSFPEYLFNACHATWADN